MIEEYCPVLAVTNVIVSHPRSNGGVNKNSLPSRYEYLKQQDRGWSIAWDHPRRADNPWREVDPEGSLQFCSSGSENWNTRRDELPPQKDGKSII